MERIQKTYSPIDGSLYVERPLATDSQIADALAKARSAQEKWRGLGVDERSDYVSKLVEALIADSQSIAEEIVWQMGRPIAHAPGELRGFEERARYMIGIAQEALQPVAVEPQPGLERFITREPLGVVFVVAPWNYPLLTSVNAIVPALLAGNTVLLKHSAQTPLVAERYTQAANDAGLPAGVLMHLHLSHEDVAKVISDAAVGHVAFTGSVEGGRAIQAAVGKRFVSAGLELGGKDAAYVRHDASLDHAVDTLLDGAFFNAGQSCCGIKRIYVHQEVYDRFVSAYLEGVYAYANLGNPLDKKTTLGPVVTFKAAQKLRRQIDNAVAQGASAVVEESRFSNANPQTAYMAPQVFLDVDHSMAIMHEETFGPLVAIMGVCSDEQAIGCINDSAYGLTSAVFTQDKEAALSIGGRVETGTWFMNRCDYLNPALAWVGVKDSGRGCTLSRVGYEQLTRPKSYHLKTCV